MLRRARLSGPAGPLLGITVGLLAAGAVTLLEDSTYRADASIVLVRQGQPPGSDPQLAQAAEAASELFDSRAVAESASRNLGLDARPQNLLDRVTVEAQRGSSLVRIAVEAPAGMRRAARRRRSRRSRPSSSTTASRRRPLRLCGSRRAPTGSESHRSRPETSRSVPCSVR
ncbi:MAG: hypothetical protein ABIR67_06770 [Gaiellaceae bacterium]